MNQFAQLQGQGQLAPNQPNQQTPVQNSYTPGVKAGNIMPGDPIPAAKNLGQEPKFEPAKAKPKKSVSNLIVMSLIFLIPMAILGNAARLYLQSGASPNFSALINRDVEFLSVPTNQQSIEFENYRQIETSLSIPIQDNPKILSQFNPEQTKVLFHSTSDFLRASSTQSSLIDINAGLDQALLDQGLNFFNSRGDLISMELRRESESVSLVINNNVASELLLEDFPDIRLVQSPYISPNNRYVAMIFSTSKTLSVMLLVDINSQEVTIHEAPDIDNMVFSKDSSSVIYFSDLDQFLHVYDIATEEIIIDFNTSEQLTSFSSGVTYYFTSSSILSGSSTRFFNPEEPEPNQAITVWTKRNFDQVQRIYIYMPDEINRIIPLSDKILIIINRRGVMNFLNLETEEIDKVITHPDHDGRANFFHYYPNSIMVNSNEDRLIALDRNNHLAVWDIDVD
jgi:hypothetical protein